MLKFFAPILLLVLVACASTPEGKLAQAETDFRNVVETASAARRPCVEFGEDDPGCIIKADIYPFVLAAIEEGDALLDKYGDALKADNKLAAENYARSLLNVVERIAIYTSRR